MKNSCYFLILSFAILVLGSANNVFASNNELQKISLEKKVLWETRNYWDSNWEIKFSNCIEEDVSENFFLYYNIKTDCADSMIALRWIFSRIHGLAMASTLEGLGEIFSNESFRQEWKNLPTHSEWYNDELFLAALEYVLLNTYTNSLWKDSYPIKISDQTLVPGVFYLTRTIPRVSTGHTQIIIKTQKKLLTLESTVPRAVRMLYIFDFFPERPKKDVRGFRAMKWARKNKDGKIYLLPSHKHPNYSEAQFDKTDLSQTFDASVYNSLGISYDAKYRYKSLRRYLKAMLLRRIIVVNTGYGVCSSQDCSVGTQNFDNWSTPSRDEKIRETFEKLNQIVEYIGDMRFAKLHQKMLARKKIKVVQNPKIKLTWKSLESIFLDYQFNSDPRVHPLKRWGVN